MEFNKSALLGLKAELLRKQQEISGAKAAGQTTVKPKVKLKTSGFKPNKGVELREEKDREESQAPAELLRKSQQMLEKKTIWYNKLSANALSNADGGSRFLVDFTQKKNQAAPINEPSYSTENDDLAYQSDSDSEWVDFTDCLGRTKRCLREDLEEMKKRDEKLKATVGKPAEETAEPAREIIGERLEGDVQPELMSDDMQREQLRQKWEQKEQELMGAREVHYQDLLFDEARQHGVAYYAFSTDEAERLKQQKDLKDLRKETEEAQKTAAAAAIQKKRQMKERLRAARRRKRERLGLPAEDSPSEDEEEEVPEPPEPPQLTDPVQLRKEGPVREWDVGKEDPTRVLSQEEWVTLQRDQRPSEFAPPGTFEPTSRQEPIVDIQEEPTKKRNHDAPKKPKVGKKKKVRSSLPAGYEDDMQNLHNYDGPSHSVMPPGHCDGFRDDDDDDDPPAPRTRAAIPPPMNLETSRPPSMRKTDIEASVEEGLRFLREQAEKKHNSRRREFSP